jgi:hypothetical protein
MITVNKAVKAEWQKIKVPDCLKLTKNLFIKWKRQQN